MTRINPKELAYLKATVHPTKNSEKKTPWLNIFLSLPFWVRKFDRNPIENVILGNNVCTFHLQFHVLQSPDQFAKISQ